MNVVSLFNGMNTGRQALENCGFKVGKYYSSEIKPYAIELTQHHFPDTIQVGDVTKWREWDIEWSKVDLVLSGSPCQDLSAAGKRAGINGKKSSLFFTFVEILEHIKAVNPNVLFLQENVGSASKLDVGIMSRALGIYPCRINSSLVTAQMRDRYYWSNIKTIESMFDLVTDIPQPIDRKIMFKDIITSGYVERLKTGCLMESISRVQHTQNGIKSREKFGVPQIYVDKDKHTCLNTGSGKGGSQKYLHHRNETTGMLTLIRENEIVRTVNKIEMCRLQGFPDNYCDILSTAKAGSLLGDGWTLPIIEHIFSFINNK
jgi:DNA-cytosine methyltransferase